MPACMIACLPAMPPCLLACMPAGLPACLPSVSVCALCTRQSPEADRPPEVWLLPELRERGFRLPADRVSQAPRNPLDPWAGQGGGLSKLPGRGPENPGVAPKEARRPLVAGGSLALSWVGAQEPWGGSQRGSAAPCGGGVVALLLGGGPKTLGGDPKTPLGPPWRGGRCMARQQGCRAAQAVRGVGGLAGGGLGRTS